MTFVQKIAVTALAAAAVIVATTAAFVAVNPQSVSTPSATSSEIGRPFTLVSTNGEMVTDRTYRGKWLLIYFGYTHCPDDCPKALTNMGVAFDKFGADADHVQPLFITVDPKGDTPQVLRDCLQSFDRRIVGLTGSQAQTAAAAKAYRVYYEVENAGAGDYEIAHSSFFYLVNPKGEFVAVFGAGRPDGRLAVQLRKFID